jgi:hypothetical protein
MKGTGTSQYHSEENCSTNGMKGTGTWQHHSPFGSADTGSVAHQERHHHLRPLARFWRPAPTHCRKMVREAGSGLMLKVTFMMSRM